MAPPTTGRKQPDLRAARALSRRAVTAAFVFSVFVNLLMLASPLYMLQIYDRVLISRSEPTLVALSVIIAFLFLIMGFLDYARGRILARIGTRLQHELDGRVLSAAFHRLALQPGDARALSARHDLDAIARLWTSNVMAGVMDLPWALVFTAALFVFHPVLGVFAVAGVVVLVIITWANQHASEAATNEATLASLAAERQTGNLVAEAETVRSLGMGDHALARWQGVRNEALRKTLRASDRTGTYSSATRALRLFLQSAILGLGAWLVLQNELTAGAMIAGSILLGRALQPVEATISNWPVITRARASRGRLTELLAETAPEPARTELPQPRGQLRVQGLTVMPPGERSPILRNVGFELEPGQAMGVIGPSGAGKSSLAKALCGVWPPVAGSIRLDGATLDQYGNAVLGRHIGYLPQMVTLFEGTIAENIARLDPGARDGAIVAAARKAGVHDLIIQLPDGYDTRIGASGGRLSGGQMQRIGLARAFYGDPVLIILDEPNSNLDGDGSNALNEAIRAAKAGGAAVMIMAHRPAAIQECELLMMMRGGMVQAVGPRDEVLREMVRNSGDVARTLARSASA